MKKSRFINGQIAFALKQAEAGTPIEEVCRKLGISQQTFYQWKKTFGDMGVTELRKLKSQRRRTGDLSRLWLISAWTSRFFRLCCLKSIKACSSKKGGGRREGTLTSQ